MATWMKGRLGKGTAWLVCAAMLVALVGPAPAEAAYGRTEGGYGGAMLGALGGASIGTAIVGAAGIANPLLATGILATSTVGTGLLGARAGSWLGDKADAAFGAEKIWTVVGALTGGMLGIVVGPAGSLVGKIVGGAVGAALGGWIARKLAGKADADFNPRTVGALIGGINGALIGGPLGAAVGTTAGYVGGHLFDKYIFVKPSTSSGNTVPPRPDWRPGGSHPSDTDPAGGYDRQGYDAQGYDRGGFDRQGYDRDGYDKDGFDRAGFDHDGYDRDGIDRGGFDHDGRKVKDRKAYDPELYDQWWSAYAAQGGSYPVFGEGHWDAFPPALAKEMEERHGVLFRRRMAEVVRASADDLDEGLAAVRDQYREAVTALRDLAAKGASSDARRAALERVKTLEDQLEAKIKEGFGN